MKLSIVGCLSLILFTFAPGTSYAGDHPRTLAASQSTLSGWPFSAAIDANTGSAWSSAIHWTPDAYEWFAFWFDGFRETDYVRIVPRMWAGSSIHVPEHINVLYSANGTWNPLTTISLPANIPAEGQTFAIPKVTTDGLLFTTNRLRPGPSGEYYFQWAEVFGGSANCSSTAPIASSCAVKVLITENSYAYFFSATHLPGSNPPYVGIFDAEAYSNAPNYAPVGSVGDSAGARYGSSPFSFGTHVGNNDLFITRSSASFATATDPATGAVHAWGGNSAYMNGGASNVQLIKIGGDLGSWAAYWIDVKTDPDDGDRLHHYAMMSWFGSGDSSVNNISGAVWRTLQVGDGFDVTQGLVNQPVLNAGPVFECGDPLCQSYGTARVKSKFGTPNDNDTQGLIGQMTTGPDNKVYYFYPDFDATEGPEGRSGLYRREVQSYLSWMTPAVKVSDLGAGLGGKDIKIMVNYHANLQKYVVIYECNHDARYDYCVRTFDTVNLTGFAPTPNDHLTYGLDFFGDPNIPKWDNDPGEGVDLNNLIGQPGIRKNAQGQHFTDQDGQVIMYFPVGPSGSTPWSYDKGIYAKRIYIP